MLIDSNQIFGNVHKEKENVSGEISVELSSGDLPLNFCLSCIKHLI